ncbi:MAG: zinc ribbon domain-containing protein [Oscillospiraceae bacterium]
MFSGFSTAPTAAESCNYSATNNYKREQAFFFCSSYHKNSSVCSAHYIREHIVERLVLEGLQRLL